MRNKYISVAIYHGTTNSSVAYVKDGKPIVIKPNGIEEVMPSAVYIDKHRRRFVGHTARSSMLLNAPSEGNGHIRYRPDIGQDGRYEFSAAREVLTAPQLGGLVIGELLNCYRKATNDVPRACVITVPAKFADNAVAGTREAAQLAGLQHYPLLMEPVAAALAYGFNAADTRARWMIFDLGGSTLDVSLVSVRQGKIIVEDHAGDTRLGGSNFDRALMGYVLQELSRKYALKSFTVGNPKYRTAWNRLLMACKEAKIKLSEEDSALIVVGGTLCLDERGVEVKVNMPITRTQYDNLITSDLEKALNCCQGLLRKNNLEAQSVARLVLVGDSTKDPFLQAVLQERLCIPFDTRIDPMTVVVQGAALYAATQEDPTGITGDTMPKTMSNASLEKLNLDPARLLATPLNSKLLDFNLDVDLYARNGFRFIAAPANADETTLERAVQQFRNRFSLAPALAAKSYIRLGYDRYAKLDDEDVRESVGHLGNPRQRIVDELFWPHLANDSAFRPLAESRQLTPLPALAQIAAGDNLDGVLARHALAVTHHSLALAQELEFAAGRANSAQEHWATALAYWSGVIKDGRFWDYLRQRVEDFDDPRLKPEDVALLRDQLPDVILSFHTLFAETYDRAGAEACVEHVRLVAQCSLPEEAKQAAFQSLAKVLADNRLGPLNRQAEELLGVADRSLNRRSLDQRCAPILEAANQIPGFLTHHLGLHPNAVAACRFDSLSDKILDALNLKIDYSTDDRPFALLYSSLFMKRLLAWSLSSEMRQRIEHNRRNDIGHLYPDFLPDKDFDPTQCWFLESQEAHPDASFEMPMYKLTSARFHSRRILLVPRSELARMAHDGRLKIEDLPADKLPPAFQAVHAEIRALQAEYAATAKKKQAECDAACQQTEASTQHELADFDRRNAAQQVAIQTQQATVRRQRETEIAIARQDCNTTLAAVQLHQAGELAQAQASYEAVLARWQGWRDMQRLELPIGLAGIAISGLVWFVLNGNLASLPFFVIPAVILGLCGRFLIRSNRRKAAAQELDRLKQAAKDEAARIEQECALVVERLTLQARQDTNELEARLKKLAADRTQIAKTGADRVGQLRKATQQAISQLEKDVAAKKKSLQKRLASFLKPLSAKSDFPPYRKAKSDGFKDGKAPSDREVNELINREITRMLDSLSQFEKMRFLTMLNGVPDKTANDLLTKLLELPASDRTRVIKELLGNLLY